VCGRGDDVAVGERVQEGSGGDEARGVGDVGHEPGAVFVGGGAEVGVVPVARVGGGAADDEAGLEELGLLVEAGVVDELGFGVEAVRERLEVDRGCADLLLGRL